MIENDTLSHLDDTEEAADMTQAAIETDASASAASGRAKLVLKRSGAETEHVFEFGSPATVGRFDPVVGPIDIDLGSIEEGVYISRKHARLKLENGAWMVEDLGSSNGTFILREDFEKVDSAELQDGDEIAFGNARFVFHESTESAAVEPEAVAEEA